MAWPTANAIGGAMITGLDLSMCDVSYQHNNGPRFAFDVTFPAGQTSVIMGPSGSGKSTLLNLLGGFLKADRGDIVIGGQNVTHLHPSERPVSMIFQDHNLFAHLDVARNVGLGVDPHLKLDEAGWHHVEDALISVGLRGYGQRMPSTLSGGERQRVALARMLVRDRPVLLMDEAMASLGPGLRQTILALVKQLQCEKRLTVIMITHEPGDARHIADSMAFLADGRILAQAPGTNLLDSPSDPQIAAYLGIAG
ncbi:MAG: ATP-binding cassette domain-containing protein [Pseudomonadota bacterium]